MSNSLPRVSTITVVRNGEAYLAEAIDSILSQTVQPFQILVIDGRSTDRTSEIARSYGQIQYVLQPATGLAEARNLGLQYAEGEFLAFLDHDDVWMPNKLELQLRRMCANPALGYTTTRMMYLRDTESQLGKEEQAVNEARSAPTPSALMVRRELFQRVGEFDPQYTIGCDSDWFARARDLEVPAEELPNVLLRKRLHSSNLSLNGSRNRREMALIVRQSILRRARMAG